MRPEHLAIADLKGAPAPSHEILQSKVPMVDHLSTHWNQTQLAANQAFSVHLTRGASFAKHDCNLPFNFQYLRHACQSVRERRHVFRACWLRLQMPNPKTDQQDLGGTSPWWKRIDKKTLSLVRKFVKQNLFHHCYRWKSRPFYIACVYVQSSSESCVWCCSVAPPECAASGEHIL